MFFFKNDHTLLMVELSEETGIFRARPDFGMLSSFLKKSRSYFGMFNLNILEKGKFF